MEKQVKIRSFVEQLRELENGAKEYIRETIQRVGPIKVEPDADGDELSVPCYDHFTGEPVNLAVRTIESFKITGVPYGQSTAETVASSDWADGTAMWLADYVARRVGQL